MKIPKWILGSIGMMAVVVGVAFAAYTSGYQLSANGMVKIQDMPFAVGAYNAGYQVQNTTQNTYFVPTNSQAEWNAFTTNKPSGVNICDVRNGGWSDWSAWGACSVSCGGGTQTRTKTCTNPSPDCGGVECSGSDTQTQACNTQSCIADGACGPENGVAAYSVGSGLCSAGTGSGVTDTGSSFTWSCNGSGGGTNVSCSAPKKVDGGWSDWSEWGACSVSCGGGTQTQTRTCNNPSPANGGVACSGSDTQSQACNTQACPAYTYSWYQSGFGSCSTTCGSGTSYQTVYCQRNDGVSVADSFCTTTKPATSNSCYESYGCTPEPTPSVTCPEPYAVTMGTGAPSFAPDCGSQCHDVKGGWGDFYACDGSPVQCIWYGACAPN